MLKSAPRPLTAHDYRELPEGPPHYQLIEGDLYMSPSPNRDHQKILNNISNLLNRFLEDHQSGEIYFAPFDVFLTELNVYQPDLVFISNERQSIITDHGLEGAPDLVVEILSPRTSRYDRGVKRDIYARTGVKELWIIDPELKQLQIFALQQSPDAPVATYEAGQSFQSRVLPQLTVALDQVFRGTKSR